MGRPPVPQCGDAKWVKVYKNEAQNEVAIDDLVNGNPVVPEDPGGRGPREFAQDARPCFQRALELGDRCGILVDRSKTRPWRSRGLQHRLEPWPHGMRMTTIVGSRIPFSHSS